MCPCIQNSSRGVRSAAWVGTSLVPLPVPGSYFECSGKGKQSLGFLLGLCLFLFNRLQLLLYGWFVFGIWGNTGTRWSPLAVHGHVSRAFFSPLPGHEQRLASAWAQKTGDPLGSAPTRQAPGRPDEPGWWDRAGPPRKLKTHSFRSGTGRAACAEAGTCGAHSGSSCPVERCGRLLRGGGSVSTAGRAGAGLLICSPVLVHWQPRGCRRRLGVQLSSVLVT